MSDRPDAGRAGARAAVTNGCAPSAAPAPTVLAFEDERPAAERLAAACRRPLAFVDTHRFPDGEWRLRLPPTLPGQVTILRGLDRPGEKLVQLLIAARTARELGARHLTLVAPYLCYMRQDARFAPGEAISQRIVGGFLAELFDAVITVDPHLHRVRTLAEAVPARDAIALSAAPLLGRAIAARAPDALLVGPDEESAQWVALAAAAAGLEHRVGLKKRSGDRAVRVELPVESMRGRRVVVVDDVASTGHTLAAAARLAQDAGARQVDVAVTHVLMDDRARRVLAEAGVRQVWSTDTIADPTNVVSVAPLIADALERVQSLPPR